MSTELQTVEESRGNHELSVTRFFGGVDRGACVQLTQDRGPDADGFGNGLGFVTLTREQQLQLIEVLSKSLREMS